MESGKYEENMSEIEVTDDETPKKLANPDPSKPTSTQPYVEGLGRLAANRFDLVVSYPMHLTIAVLPVVF